ncbi:MAG: NUDIX domain-containing protein [Bradyrhizobium sp.]|nr:NUDIX domain-containing protein [Bradyrhizobium sp.]
MNTTTIKIVAALVRDDAGRVLLVRKRGTKAFMQPGGKRNSGEDDVTALAREIAEELGCHLVPASVRSLGRFDAVAANEPGFRVEASLYAAELSGQITPSGEIEEMIWLDPLASSDVLLAPLTRDHVLPLACALGEA